MTTNDTPTRSDARQVERLGLLNGQERFYELSNQADTSSFRNVVCVISVKGELSVDRLQRSLRECIKRQPGLQAAFTSANGQLAQVIDPASAERVEIQRFDLPASTRQAEDLECLLEVETTRPFDLNKSPLMRICLFQLAGREQVLLLVIHPIVADHWSLVLLLRDLAAFYSAQGNGVSQERLSEIGTLYEQYASAAREQSGAEDTSAKRRKQAWLRLEDGAAWPRLPSDKPRSTKPGQPISRHSFVLSEQTRLSLQSFSSGEQSSIPAATLTTFCVLLQKYCQQSRLLIAHSLPLRARSRFTNLVAPLTNLGVLQTDLSGDPSFREALRRVIDSRRQAEEHGGLPFSETIDAFWPQTPIGEMPFCRVMFVEAPPTPALVLGDASLEVIAVDANVAISDLAFIVSNSGDQVKCTVEYSAGMFEASTIERFAGHFQALLEGALSEPDARISQLPLLTEAEKRQILVEWNNTRREYAGECCAHGLFEEQARQTPGAIAVSCAGERISYEELRRRADTVTRLLVSRGVEVESIVASLGERSANLLATMLGIFGAGGAYLPLDPLHPTYRHAQVLNQSRCRFLIVDRTSLAVAEQLLPGLALPRIELIVLDDYLNQSSQGEATGVYPSNTSIQRATPANLSYVIYTSGSTGTPKGVMVEHRGMLNHLYAKIEALDLSPTDCIAQNASQSFDISIWQFLAGLLVGARVDIIGPDVAHDPRQLLRHVEHENITILEVVPSLLQALVDVSEQDEVMPLPSLRYVLPTGEALPPELCRKWFKLYPHIPLVNAYGPTECSDDVTHHFIYEQPEENALTVPIGQPIANTQAFILDVDQQLRPAGIPGELYIGGAGVSRGYLHQADLTAERFVPNPFSESQAGDWPRLYKTGDLARYLPGGIIEFLGRIDSQVKIRGFRIEVEEIESVLRGCPAVRQCVVTDYGEGSNKLLAAYVVTRPDGPQQEQAIRELRGFLEARLPGYMVPSAFVLLDQLPLTPNGKLDRKALPEPGLAGQYPGQIYVEPQSLDEKLLVNIWEDVFGRSPIGVSDNFIELGGHSLLAAQIVARILDAFAVELPLRTLFDAPTIRQLAVRIEEKIIEQIEQLSEEEALAMLDRLGG